MRMAQPRHSRSTVSSRGRPQWAAAASALLWGLAQIAHAGPAIDEDGKTLDDAPLDRAGGAAFKPGKARSATSANTATSGIAAPRATPAAAAQGTFGPVINWPIIPIHMALLPDGRMLNFGSNPKGSNVGNLYYSVWDPSLGTGADAFTLLPASITTDVFCAATSVIASTGEVLIGGGTRVVAGQRGYGNNATSVFAPSTNQMSSISPMVFQRWYATMITLPDGNDVILGGRIDKTYPKGGGGGEVKPSDTTAAFASTPELFDTTSRTWTALGNAASDKAYGKTSTGWYYPQGWVAPDGRVFILSHGGLTFDLAPAAGVLNSFSITAPVADQRLSSVMYQPGKILSIRNSLQVVTVDINGSNPVVTLTSPISRHRLYGNATVLADGKVFVNGGSPTDNILDGNEHYISELWDPATGAWTLGPTAAKPRLYHSNALLMPDGTVVTGGGGAPGPVKNLNAEVYFPAYLYSADGTPAPRPSITSAPAYLGWGQDFSVEVDSATPVSRVTLLRSGTATHAFNNGQRFFDLQFTQTGTTVLLTTPANGAVAPPGYYMLFAFDSSGVPSTAKMIRIAP